MIICLLIPLGAASASDINTTDDQVLSATPNVDTISANVNNGENSNDTLSVNDEKNILSAGLESGNNNLLGADEENSTVGTVDELIQLISLSRNKVTLEKDYVLTKDLDQGITVNNLIINGNNHTIDFNKKVSGFIGQNFTLENINLINFGTGSFLVNCNVVNSCILSTTAQIISSNVNFKKTFFINLRGTISVVGFTNFIDCDFSNFRGTRSSGPLIYPVAGASCYVDGCTFDDIYSSEPDAGHQLFSTLKGVSFIIKNSNFINVRTNGIPIFANNNMFLDNCYFERVTSPNGFFNGKYLSMNNCTLNGTSFIKADFVNSTNNVYLNNSLTIDSGSSHYFVNDTFVNGTTLTISSQYVKILNSNFTNYNGTADAPLIINSDFTTVNGCIFYNTSGVKNGAITVNNDVSARLSGNTYDTLSKLDNVTADVKGFDLFDFLYVGPADGDGIDPNGNGTDPINDLCSLSYAYEHIIEGGTIYLTNGTYEFSERKSISYNIIGYKNDKVIINNGTFNLNSLFLKIENIIFNNTTYRLNLGSYNILNKCNFTNTTLSSDFIIFSDMNDNITHVNFENVKTNYTLGLIGVNSFNRFDDVNFTKCDLTSVFKLAGFTGPEENAFSDTFENICVNNSTIGIFSYHAFQCPDMNFNNIIINNSNITNTLFKRSYAKSFGAFNYNIDGFSIENSRVIGDNIILFNQVDYKENPVYNMEYSYSYNDIHVNNVITKSAIFNIVTDFTLTNSSFDKINSNNVLIKGESSISNLDNISLNRVNISSLVSNHDLNNKYNKIRVNNSNFNSNIILTLLSYNTLDDSIFENYTGHIIVKGEKVEFTNTSFKNGNNTKLNGSAVEVVSGNYIGFTDCNFTKNNGSNGAVYIFAGSLRPSFINCRFIDNYADEFAGAIYFNYNEGEGTVVTFSGVTEGTLPNRNGEKENGVYGNLTEAVSDVYVINDTDGKTASEANAKTPETPGTFDTAYAIAGKNCVFHFVKSGNVFNYTGKPLEGYAMESLDSGWVFKGNNTTIVNLRLHITNGDLKVYNITFRDNTAGSVVLIDDENVLFDNCSFINNRGDKILYGGAIQINANNINITNCKFINNTAENNTAGYGGALYVNASHVVINNNTFNHNSVFNTGSHIYINENLKEITINNNTFKNSYRLGNGYASSIVIQGDNIDVAGCIFDNNTGLIGSALSLIGNINNININNNTFKNNTADENGAVYLSYDNGLDTLIKVEGNTFKYNTAVNDGGALYINTLTRPELLSIANNTCYNNSAVNGGAIFINMPQITLKDMECLENNTAKYGGAVYVNANGVTIRNVNFTRNNATYGGALYVNALNTNVVNSNFIANIANTSSSEGSAVYVSENGGVTLTNVELNKNYVYGENGTLQRGDIYVNQGKFGDNGINYGSDPYKQYLSNMSVLTLTIAYVSETGGGSGSSYDSPATLTEVLELLEPNSIIYLVGNEDLTFNNYTLKNLNNVTVINYNDGKNRKIKGNDKYLFNLLT